MDINEHKPMVDEWMKMASPFKITMDKYGIVLKAGRISLYFVRQEDGEYRYDGWSTHLRDLNIKV